MTTIHRLDPPIPMTTPKGDAKAVLYVDRGVDNFGEWVTFVLATGECWTWLDKDVRLWACETEGRRAVTPFAPAPSPLPGGDLGRLVAAAKTS